jgi:hypothetical protein
MARRRVKKRTHLGAQNGANATANGKPMDRSPKSMVVRIGAGEIGPSVSQLVKDMRLVMEPGTASRLKVYSRNRLSEISVLTSATGAQVKQAARLYDHVRAVRSYALAALFTIRFREYEHATCYHTEGANTTFSRRKLFPL